MKIIKLTKNKIAFIDDEDYIEISKYKWHAIGGLYAARSVHNKGNKYMVYMHRQIMKAPKNKEIDHKDGNKLNNQKSNLRIVSRSENLCNTKPRRNKRVPYKGVDYLVRDNKYRAVIQLKGKRVRLGVFASATEAALAYDEAARELHGEFTRTNFKLSLDKK